MGEKKCSYKDNTPSYTSMYCHSIDRYWKLHNEYNQRCMYTHLQHSFRDRPQPFLRPLVEPINVTTIHQRGKHPQASAKRVADRAETQNNVQIFTAPLDKRVVFRHGVVVVVVGHALLSPPANQSHRKKALVVIILVIVIAHQIHRSK